MGSGVIELFTTSSGVNEAIAALKSDGSVEVWGHANYGGDPGGVDLSSGIIDVIAGTDSFVALRSDGSAEAWGHPDNGGDSSGVDLTGDIQTIYRGTRSFAALKTDGSVVAWGSEGSGGDFSPLDLSSGVVDVSTEFLPGMFTAQMNDGRRYLWGVSDLLFGQTYLDLGLNINKVRSTLANASVAILRNDGTVDVYGHPDLGGDLSGVDLYSP